MKILSFDQATRISGYALFEDGRYIESGRIDLSKEKELDTDERSFAMAKELWKLIFRYKPDQLIIEDIQQQANPHAVIILARLGGMIIGYAKAHNIQVHILAPSRWRKELEYSQGPKVKRQELKQQSLDYVKKNLGLELPEDEAEAACINMSAQKIFNI